MVDYRGAGDATLSQLYGHIEGNRFGRLIAKERYGVHKDRSVLWLCECDCGALAVVKTTALAKGRAKSCGCAQYSGKNHTTHGLSKKSPVFSTWNNMRRRCSNPTRSDYKYYGGRGIAVCDAWINDFSAFHNWAMNNGYEKGLTIDRIKNDGNYEPDNCRWIPLREQFSNRRSSILIEINGRVQSLSQWCRECGLNYGRIHVYLWLHPELDKTNYLIQCIKGETRRGTRA